MNLTVNGESRESIVTNLSDLWRSETEHLNLDSPKGEIVRAMQGG
jgi:hypothetical protein